MFPLQTRAVARAFTVIELIVAVGVVAVLAALFLPVLSLARRSAQAAACLSNLREIGAGASLYSADHDHLLIPECRGTGSQDAVTWRVLIQPYLGIKPDKNVFVCPADRIGAQSPKTGAKGVIPASYGINDAGTHGGNWNTGLFEYLATRKGKRVTDVVKPSRTIFISDLGRPDNPGDPVSKWVENARNPGAASYGYARFPSETSYSSAGDDWNIYPRHGAAKANVLFFDGHAGAVDILKDIVNHPPGDPECLYDNQ